MRYDIGNTKKIAISLPADLVKELERTMKKTGESRSAVIRHLIEKALMQDEMDIRVKQYIDGYMKHPETDEEKKFTKATSTKAFEEESWE